MGIASKLNGVNARSAKRHALVLKKLIAIINENHRKNIDMNPRFRLRMDKSDADIAKAAKPRERKLISYNCLRIGMDLRKSATISTLSMTEDGPVRVLGNLRIREGSTRRTITGVIRRRAIGLREICLCSNKYK